MADWHHAPLHRFGYPGAYFVTSSTLHKEHHFRGRERLSFLAEHLQTLAHKYDIELEAWAVFSNHYHVIARPHGEPGLLHKLLKHLHADAGREANKWDQTPGRQVWFQYRDTALTFQESYFARLAYVMHNPVKHGLVQVASAYPYCSKGWFDATASRAQFKMLSEIKIDRVNVEDDFDPII